MEDLRKEGVGWGDRRISEEETKIPMNPFAINRYRKLIDESIDAGQSDPNYDPWA